MELNFTRTSAPDGIHDEFVVNEYAPRGGWLEHYRRKDGLRDTLLASVLVLLYLAASTLAYFWG